MSYWIKVNYDHREYVIDLDRLSTFTHGPNGKITFWLPDSTIPIIVNRQSDPDGYQRVVNYIQKLSARSPSGFWITFNYERHDYILDLNKISSFCHYPNQRLTFWLPDSSMPIIISEQKNPDIYHKIIDYIEQKTGYLLT